MDYISRETKRVAKQSEEAGKGKYMKGESVDIKAEVEPQPCCVDFEGLTASWHGEGSKEFKSGEHCVLE